RAEGIRGLERDAVAAIGKQTEEGEHRAGSEQPGLLADDGEDEVGVGKGKPLVLLNAVTEANPGETTRPERDDRLNRLEPGVERIGPGIDEGQDAMQSIGLHPNEDVDAEGHDQQQQQYMALAPTGHQELGEQNAGEDQGGAQVAL